MNIQILKSKKVYIPFLIILALIFSGLVLYFYSSSARSSLEINLEPDDTTFSINGTSYIGNKKINLEEGTYTIEFKRKCFYSTTKTVDLKRGQTERLDVVLETNPKSCPPDLIPITDKEVIQEAGDKKLKRFTEDLISNNPLIKKLPYDGPNFRVDYGVSGTGDNSVFYDITLYTTASGLNESQIKNNVTAWFKEQGYSLDSLKHNWFTE